LSRLSRLAVTLGLAGIGLMAPATASAVPPGSGFSCRASAARVALTGVPTIEPFVANAADKPCAAGSANVVTPTAIGPLNVNVVNVSTSQTPATLGSASLANGDHASAASTVTNPTVTLGALIVHADVLTATAAYTCQNGAPVASNSGQVVGLTINGQATSVPPGDNQSISLGPLGTLVLNQVDTSVPGRVTRRAIDLTTPLGTVVISEATADISGNPCAVESGTPPGGTPPGGTPPGGTPPGGTPPGGTPPGGTPPGGTKPPGGTSPGAGKKHVRGTARLIVSPPATARRIRMHQCVRGFVATVVGRRIKRVVFSLDGQQIAVARRGPFRTVVHANPGGHNLLARVTFVTGSHTGPRTLRLHYVGCSAITPVFTG